MPRSMIRIPRSLRPFKRIGMPQCQGSKKTSTGEIDISLRKSLILAINSEKI
jgi:hypothetical protein